MGIFEQHLLRKEKLKSGDIVRLYKSYMEYKIVEIKGRHELFRLVPVQYSNTTGQWYGFAEISEVVKTNHMRIIR